MQLAVLSLLMGSPAAATADGAALPLQNGLLQGSASPGLLSLLGGQSFSGLLQGQLGELPAALPGSGEQQNQNLPQFFLLQGNNQLPLAGATLEQILGAIQQQLAASAPAQQPSDQAAAPQPANIPQLANILIQLPEAEVSQPVLPVSDLPATAPLPVVDVEAISIPSNIPAPAQESVSAALALLQGQQATQPKQEKPAVDLQNLAASLTKPAQIEILGDQELPPELQQTLSRLAQATTKESSNAATPLRLVALPVNTTETAEEVVETAETSEPVQRLVTALRDRVETSIKKPLGEAKETDPDLRPVTPYAQETKKPEPVSLHKQPEQWINNNAGAVNAQTPAQVKADVAPATIPTALSSDKGADLGSGGDQNFSSFSNSAASHGAGSLASEAARAVQHTESQFSKLLNHPQPAVPIHEQMLVHIRAGMKEGRSSIKIQLEPMELGRVEVRLDVGSDGRTGIVVTADNRDTLELLQRDSRSLERMLQDAGIKADAGGMSFNLRHGGHQQNAQGEPWMNAYGSYQQPQAEAEEELLMQQIMGGSYLIQANSGIDIHV